MNELVPALSAAPALFAVGAWLARGRTARALALLGTGVTLAIALTLASWPENWSGALSFFRFDGRGAFHAVLASLIALAAAAVTFGHAGEERDRSAPFLLALLSATLVALSARPMAARLVALEFAALFGALLVASDRAELAIRAAWRHLATATAAVSFVAIGCAIASAATLTDAFAQEPAAIGAPHGAPSTILSLLLAAGLGALVGAAPVGIGIDTLLRGIDGARAAPVVALSAIAAVDLLTRLAQLTSSGPLLALGAASLLVGGLGLFREDIAAASHATYAGIVLVGLGLSHGVGNHAVVAALLANAALVLARSLRLLAEETPVSGVFDFFARSLGFGGMPPTASFLATLAILRAALAAGRPWLTALIALAVTATGVGLLQDARESDVAAADSPNPYAVVALGLLAVALLGLGLAIPAHVAALLEGAPAP